MIMKMYKEQKDVKTVRESLCGHLEFVDRRIRTIPDQDFYSSFRDDKVWKSALEVLSPDGIKYRYLVTIEQVEPNAVACIGPEPKEG